MLRLSQQPIERRIKRQIAETTRPCRLRGVPMPVWRRSSNPTSFACAKIAWMCRLRLRRLCRATPRRRGPPKAEKVRLLNGAYRLLGQRMERAAAARHLGREFALWLNEQGVVTRKAGARWRPSTVIGALARRARVRWRCSDRGRRWCWRRLCPLQAVSGTAPAPERRQAGSTGRPAPALPRHGAGIVPAAVNSMMYVASTRCTSRT